MRGLDRFSRLAVAFALASAPVAARAAPEETFFGEDPNFTNDEQTAEDDPLPLTVRPNADAARAAFLATLAGVATESFDSFGDGAPPPIELTFGGDTATLTGSGNVLTVGAGVSFNGVFPTSGSNVYFLFLTSGSSSFSIGFSSPQAAFGFYATDIGDGFGQLVLRFHRPDQTTSDVVVPHTLGGTTGSIFYFGITSPEAPFDSVTFINSGSGDGFGFDDLTIGRASQVVPTIDSFFLPKRVVFRASPKGAEKNVLKVSGFFDTGSKSVDLTAAATLTIGSTEFAIPSLTAWPDGRKFTHWYGGLTFVVLKNPFGSSRAKFRLTFVGDLGVSVPADGALTLRFENDAVDGTCEVLLSRGGFRLGKTRGSLSKPNLFVVRTRASVPGGGKDSLSLIVGLATGGVTPPAAEDVFVEFGAGLSQTIPAGSFVRKGDKFVFKGESGGVTGVTLDYAREIASIQAKGLDFGTLAEGQNPLRIVVGLGGLNRGVAVRVARKGATVKY